MKPINKNPKSIRLTNQHFAMIRSIFFLLTGCYSLVKIESLINHSFSQIKYFQSIEDIRNIYYKKDIIEAIITTNELMELIENISALYNSINPMTYHQSHELRNELIECSIRLKTIVNDFYVAE
jgi:hypothetical protein